MKNDSPQWFLIYGLPSIPGTAASNLKAEDWKNVFPLSLTSAGSDRFIKEEQNAGSALMELRRCSGLTWEKLSQLFGVSQRSLHSWASGKPLNMSNEEHLRRLLAAIRLADRGWADLNRKMLLCDCDGVIPLDLLVQKRYDEFIELVGKGPGRPEIKLKPLSKEAREARKPFPGGLMVGALEDRVHKEVGEAWPARTYKITDIEP